MHQRLHACGFLLLLGAGLASGAESAAPLEATKQELRQLEKEQKTRAATAPGASVGLETPTLQLQQPGADSPQQWLSEKLKKERRQKEEKDQKNWLVDGVQKLEKNDSAQRAAAKPAGTQGRTATSPGVIDTSDPQYLLKLFDEQKGSTAKEAKPVTGKGHAATPDAFAPFLQEWLGNSPARGQFFDQFVRPTENNPLPTANPAGAGEPHPAGTALEAASAVRDAAPKPNPYLIELNNPVLRDLPAESQPAAFAPTAALGNDLNRAAASPAAPDVRPAAKGPPPGLADDKKYFPQLKKF